MPFLIALAVVFILCVFFISLRAYMVFSLVIASVGAMISGIIMDEPIFLFPGLIGIVLSILIILFTVRKVKPGEKVVMALNFFLYGMFIFIKIFLYAMIILIPIGIMASAVCADYRERITADGRRVYVTRIGGELYDTCGNKYTE